ncbi:MAG: zf-HC2 domain-containing protein [Bacteroidetes bacterium]|nr:zf-HC2 domain-containing protein [Bacteroidota bacterium]MBU1680942.1 zf-HC2 domain-containing protein [Bacteroidota bacterium]MBU2505526.1 zf-HC2 domain-containing protein [Bacteroidota bacterium]
MNCDEIRSKIDDYFDGLLNPDESGSVRQHIEFCPECKSKLKLLQSLSEELKGLPLEFEPPKSVIKEITDALLYGKREEELEKKAKEKKEDSLKKQKRKDSASGRGKKSKDDRNIGKGDSEFKMLYAGSIAIIFALIYYFTFITGNTGPWNINSQRAAYKVNGITSTAKSVDAGDTFEVPGKDSVKLVIPDIGSIILSNSASIKIDETSKSNNQVTLKSGRFSFTLQKEEANMHIKYSGTSIMAARNNFVCEVDPNGYLTISSQTGTTVIKRNSEILNLAADYLCKLSPDGSIGIPYHNSASNKLKSALSEYEANIQNYEALTVILVEANSSDALTLLRLIKRSAPANREMIYQKLYLFFPPPLDVTRLSILNLNEEAFIKWWKEIEWQL